MHEPNHAAVLPSYSDRPRSLPPLCVSHRIVTTPPSRRPVYCSPPCRPRTRALDAGSNQQPSIERVGVAPRLLAGARRRRAVCERRMAWPWPGAAARSRWPASRYPVGGPGGRPPRIYRQLKHFSGPAPRCGNPFPFLPCAPTVRPVQFWLPFRLLQTWGKDPGA